MLMRWLQLRSSPARGHVIQGFLRKLRQASSCVLNPNTSEEYLPFIGHQTIMIPEALRLDLCAKSHCMTWRVWKIPYHVAELQLGKVNDYDHFQLLHLPPSFLISQLRSLSFGGSWKRTPLRF